MGTSNSAHGAGVQRAAMGTSNSAHRAAAASSSSSRRSNRWKYEVFLSFRGEDTRNTFTNHLFIALRNAGINTFIDDRLTRGENIQSELDQEIEGSRIAVIVFSKRYAESRWCLRELSKIMRCREDQEGKIVCPIFYDVDPSQVRKQKDSFGEAFQKHEKDEDRNEVKQWREDLKASADLGGWNLKTTADGCEGVFINKIVGDIQGLLKPTDFKEDKHSVGMANRVQEFSTKYLDVGGSHDVQIIGIWGMGGIGKTTLARAVYSNYQHSFSRQCYLEDVRSKKKEMVSLQEQLLRDILKQPDIKVNSVAEGTKEIEKRLGSMKVLIVVDDIDDADQLDELAIERESFGLGSRIIITTRDEQVLNIKKVDKRYKAQTMTDEEALKLLSWHAFANPCPDEEYFERARDVVDYCGGLPLALKVVGRLLATKESKTIWESTLDKLRNIPNGKIHETLKLSYDGLPDNHVKGVFLDISHFYVGTSKSITTAILNDCSNFRVEAEITTLCDRCLLYIGEDETLRMHDLIRDMGREIVRAESSVEGKRSRLWRNEEAKSVLKNESGTKAVEGLCLNSDDEQSFSTEAFKKMWRLKNLILGNVKLTGSYRHISKELRVLVWNGFPLEAIPADFDQRNLFFLCLWNSKIVRVWEDSELLPKKLKYLSLKDCHNLTELPDFSKLPHLKELYISGCKGLCGGYHFLAQLKMIEQLYLGYCNITDGAVLEIIGSLSSLTYLNLSGNGFNRLPILSGLSQLQDLYLSRCTNLKAIPDLPNSLRVLHANYCTALEIMSDFSEMSKMRKLELKDCHKLKDIPNLENSMEYINSIHMEGCTSLTDTFKENLQTKNAFGGIFLSGNDIPSRLAYVAREDETVKFEVPPSIDYIGGLALGIVYSSHNSNSTGSLRIHVHNSTQRTYFRIRPMEATVIASHEYCLWLGNLSNKKLNLKDGDKVLVRAEFYGGDNRIKVNKTGVDIVKWDLSDGLTNWDDYETVPYVSEDATLVSFCHVFLCFGTPDFWQLRFKGCESEPFPEFCISDINAAWKNVKSITTVIGREGTEFSDLDLLIFQQMKKDGDALLVRLMIKYRDLRKLDGFHFGENLIGAHVFVCVHCSGEEWNLDSARVLIDKFKEEAELRGLTNKVFVTACYHNKAHNGNLIMYSPYGSKTGHWYGYVTPDDVPELFDQHIEKGEIIERLWRGQIGASSNEVEEINDRELPNGEENKKIKEKPQENGNKANQVENGENFIGCCHVFLCYKTPEAWPWHNEGVESDPLPKFFASALKARKNDITVKTLLTIIEGCEGTEFSDGDVLIFPQMIKYRGLKESDVDSFVDDVLVNHQPWASGVQEPLTGPYVFICAHMNIIECNPYLARGLIDKFKEGAELRRLTDQVFVTACFHIGDHKYAGNLVIYSPGSDGSIKDHWYSYVKLCDVPKLLNEHIGKGENIERLLRGQMGASSDEAEEISNRELPNGEENKKIEEKPLENKKNDVLAAAALVGAVASVAMACIFYIRSG